MRKRHGADAGWRSARSMWRFAGVSLVVMVCGLLLTSISTIVGGLLAVAGLVGILVVVYVGGFLAR